MKKINRTFLFFGIAFVFMTIVMLRLLPEGIILRERPMIQWALIKDLNEFAAQVSPYLGPLLKDQKVIWVNEGVSEAQNLLTAIQVEIEKSLWPVEMVMGDSEMPHSFQVLVLPADEALLKPQCEIEIKRWNSQSELRKSERSPRPACLGLKALKKWKNKSRSPGLWISLYRLSQSSVVFFIVEKK